MPSASIRSPALIEIAWTLVCFALHFGALLCALLYTHSPLTIGAFTKIDKNINNACTDSLDRGLHLACGGADVVARILVLLGVLSELQSLIHQTECRLTLHVVLIHHISIYQRLWAHRHNDLFICTDMADLVLCPTASIPSIPLPLELGQVLDIQTALPTVRKDWPRTDLFISAEDEFTDIPLDVALGSKEGPPTGFGVDARPEWARAMTIARGREAPFPSSALRAVTDLRQPAPVRYASARRQSSVPSTCQPSNPTPTRATFVSSSTLSIPDTLWSDGSCMRTSLPPPPLPPKDMRHMPSADRMTVWSQASYMSSEVPPPLPTMNRDPLLSAEAWVPLSHEAKAKAVVRTKASPPWRRHRLVDDGGFFQPWIKTKAA